MKGHRNKHFDTLAVVSHTVLIQQSISSYIYCMTQYYLGCYTGQVVHTIHVISRDTFSQIQTMYVSNKCCVCKVIIVCVCALLFYYPDHYDKSCLLVKTAYPSGASEFILDFQWSSFFSVFSFMCIVSLINVCPFLSVLLAIVMSGLL